MNKLDKDYQELLKDILANGVEKSDRTGTGTISIFGRQIRHNMRKGFPLLTTKKMAVKTMMTELKWFLKGDTNIKYLVDNGCNIWNGDAYKNFLQNSAPHDHQETMEEFIEKIKTDDEFAKKWGELGPIYGAQWRDWETQVTIPTTLRIDDSEPLCVRGTKYIDQIENLLNDIKTNPDSRRLMVSAWNPGDQPEMALPPCHYGFQVYTRKLTQAERIQAFEDKGYIKNVDDFNLAPKRAISLMWNQRSVDTPLGLPFNIASYATLLLLLAEECNMVADELIGNLGDTHIYSNQVDGVNEQVERGSFKLPTLKLSNVNILAGEFDWEVLDYECHSTIKFPLSN